ncbi:ABC transporter permease [Roseovarius sp.]|jgi:peptide/nickel transport system permease protein|uniref:ABC transporter permease n=1 Tax=Roseovarius sp. TaxID=1486281 RepID=UPI00260C0D87|nr:ABC transporter permease [Roseovarius sp.]MDM8164827.1 ABC transporter permease [Roseovarius sp.]
MISFLLSRAVQAIATMLMVTLIAFVLFRYVGDPVNQMVGIETSLADRAKLREDLGLNDPMPVQYARFLVRAARFDFGTSYQQKESVAVLIGARLPATLELSLISVVFAIAAGVPLGVLAGLHPRSLAARAFMALSLLGVSLPTFLIGILLIFVFSVHLGWLPSFGRGQTVQIGGWSTGLLTASGWRSIILPAITLGLFQMTLIMRLVRAEIMEVLRTDYIKFARARGLPDRIVHFGHALRNTLIPVITVTGLQIGSIIAFSIITETVFQWPGMGLLFLQAVQNADVPVMAAYLMLIAALFVTINLAVDLLYMAVDPRIRIGRAAA